MKIIALTNQGGARYDVDFGVGVYTLITKYNYTAACWTMDMIDSVGVTVLSGLMLVPGIDILSPYPFVSSQIGTLAIIEKNNGDYMNPEALGKDVLLVWISTSELQAVV
jgi:hypothetical protein